MWLSRNHLLIIIALCKMGVPNGNYMSCDSGEIIGLVPQCYQALSSTRKSLGMRLHMHTLHCTHTHTHITYTHIHTHTHTHTHTHMHTHTHTRTHTHIHFTVYHTYLHVCSVQCTYSCAQSFSEKLRKGLATHNTLLCPSACQSGYRIQIHHVIRKRADKAVAS